MQTLHGLPHLVLTIILGNENYFHTPFLDKTPEAKKKMKQLAQ